MDELQLVRDFYGTPPPPSEDTVASARALLAGQVPSVARRRIVRYGAPATAVAAAAAVAVALAVQSPAQNTAARKVAAPSTLHRSAPGSGSSAPSPAASGLRVFSLPAGAAVGTPSGSARVTLQAAAAEVASAPQPTTGRYYVTDGTVGRFLREGPASNPYVVLDLAFAENWAARSPKDGSPQFGQQLSVQLASPADRAAWQRDGSPTVWPDTPQYLGLLPVAGIDRPLTTARGKLVSIGATYGGQQFQVGTQNLTLRQLHALPADPARLKTLLLKGSAPGYGSSIQDQISYLLQSVPEVLEMPVTPAVRAALYEMLAALPGMQNLGTVTDVGGQQGYAVGYTASYDHGCGGQIDLAKQAKGEDPFTVTFPSCSSEQVLIIDPGTGMPLAYELRYASLPAGDSWSAPDGLLSYELFGTPYWTNHNRPRG